MLEITEISNIFSGLQDYFYSFHQLLPDPIRYLQKQSEKLVVRFTHLSNNWSKLTLLWCQRTGSGSEEVHEKMP